MIDVRPFRPDDAQLLDEVHRAAFPEPLFGPAYWRADRSRAPALCLVAEEAGRVLAYCDGFTAGEGGDVNSIAVRPEARGRGVGHLVLTAFLNAAYARGAVVIHLEVATDNAPALALYDRAGFERVGTRRDYYGPGADAAVLARPLGA
ncbi:GNAT family N-acetyltransferase [Parvularcula dongshanensis]|uniref:Ribosomal-protein-alanine N-acetyltransferase n=1 Tax=Parvularcula dongshanensis TaxID=1173995 RepID=A0A840I1F6_9PROT|nr:GNAT family N-acetyltransferase [Parvularcula dongshanensis]MBB4658113.1 ribosomal-protein-alanine N-acetyltransferase [Parvularcula dongshanensis]